MLRCCCTCKRCDFSSFITYCTIRKQPVISIWKCKKWKKRNKK